MRDDVAPPNLGTSEAIPTQGTINRLIRTIEHTLKQMLAVGQVRVTYINFSPVTVATLPEKRMKGDVAFVSNGRKVGEGAGAGTGVLVFYDGSNWIACDSGQPVSV